MIDSGNGIQPIWRLGDPLDADEEYVPQIERLGRRIEAALGGVENTCNIDRVLEAARHDQPPEREEARRAAACRCRPASSTRLDGCTRGATSRRSPRASRTSRPSTRSRSSSTPAATATVTTIDLDADLPPVATDEQLEALFENYPHIKAIWDKSTPFPPEDQSPSGWDQKFTSALAREGFEPAQLAAYLRAFRAHHEPTKGKQNRR